MKPETVERALAEIAEESPAAAEALCCASLLAEAPIPFEMAIAAEGAMHNPALINPAAAMFAVAATLDPLCSRGLAEMDHATGTFSVPPEVRTAVRATMSEDETLRWQTRAIHALSLAVPDANPDTPVLEALAPHVQVCLDLARDGFATPDVNRVLHQYGFSLHFSGRHHEAAELVDAALTVDLVLKPEAHPDIVADLEGLGTILAAAGDHQNAVMTFRRCKDLLEKEWTEDNQALIPVIAGLALSLRALGEHREAVKLAGRASKLFEKHFGNLPVEPEGRLAECLNLLGSGR